MDFMPKAYGSYKEVVQDQVSCHTPHEPSVSLHRDSERRLFS